ncbi:MAG: pyridoxal-phosphate dependent enzyme [Gammaproteobacteria bacterium]|nr:pyridoxal-phosphate dependent enzyme [Gammaproteobacteria bacterium]
MQYISEPMFHAFGVELAIKREDMLHPVVSGNKWRKLKYNMLEARKQGYKTLLSFGGAYSNHIHALAGVGRELDVTTIGLIRGESFANDNPTLSYARHCGMQLYFVDRATYRRRHEPDYIEELMQRFGPCYLLPEGGSNLLAVKGVAELWQEVSEPFDYVAVAAGTGATAAGVISGAPLATEIRVFAVLKGAGFLRNEISGYLDEMGYTTPWRLHDNYHFGAYARISPQLVAFMDRFEALHQIPLDPVYTAKMLYGVYDQIRQGAIPPGSRVLAIHTGGLQGRHGMETRMQSLRTHKEYAYE